MEALELKLGEKGLTSHPWVTILSSYTLLVYNQCNIVLSIYIYILLFDIMLHRKLKLKLRKWVFRVVLESENGCFKGVLHLLPPN